MLLQGANDLLFASYLSLPPPASFLRRTLVTDD